jgi:hypothetical protein
LESKRYPVPLLRRIQLTTDGFNAYIDGVEEAFGADVDYAQLIKEFGPEDPDRARYAPPVVIGVTKVVVNGSPNKADISTSYVEPLLSGYRSNNDNWLHVSPSTVGSGNCARA